MINQNIFSFNVKWNYRAITLFAVLLILPNLLGLINLATPWGFKIHHFQFAIFMAAFIYGPKGGAISGLVGSLYAAFLMQNPYLIVGNVLLGFFAGWFFRKRLPAIAAVMIVFLIQLPWLVVTDYYLVHMPVSVILRLVLALAVSNVIWAAISSYLSRPVKRSIRC